MPEEVGPVGKVNQAVSMRTDLSLDVPIQAVFFCRNPASDITQTAHVVKLYTKRSGKYFATAQQYCSHLIAQFLGWRR